MNCKNCENSLQTDYSYCPDCGAKVVRNRLTVKNLFQDVIERYFNLDNTFLRTFTHLFTKPEVVIDGYVNGIRKKYVNPTSYFTIALMFAAVLMFFMRNVFDLETDMDFYNQGMSPEVQEKIFNFSMDYSSLFFVLYIPILVIAGLLTLNKKKYILAEYTISIIYSLAQWSITSFFTSFVLMCFFPKMYMTYSLVMTIILFVYIFYVAKRIHSYKFSNLILRAIAFTALILFFFFGIMIVAVIIGAIIGAMNPDMFTPK